MLNVLPVTIVYFETPFARSPFFLLQSPFTSLRRRGAERKRLFILSFFLQKIIRNFAETRHPTR